MSRVRFDLIWLGAAAAAVAFVVLQAWSLRHAPLWKVFERTWAADVARLESSGKLPPEWAMIKTIDVIGGTPETRAWLKLVEVPLKTNPRGLFHMDVLVVVWEEDGRRGVMIQYNLEDLKTKNMVREIGRTLLLESLPWLPR